MAGNGRFGGIGRGLVGIALLVPLVGLLAMSGGTSAEAAGTAQVQVIDFDYSPVNLTIRAGTTVRWTNVGNQIHTVVSTDGAFVSSSDLVPNTTAASHAFLFTEQGMYSYYCYPYHEFMVGTITVLPPLPTATPLPRPAPRPQVTLVPPALVPARMPAPRTQPTPVTAAQNTATPLPLPVRRAG